MALDRRRPWVRWPDVVALSPVVESRIQRGATLGLMYDVSPTTRPGLSTPADCARVLRRVERLQRHSHHAPGLHQHAYQGPDEHCRIRGRAPFIERLNGWPLDFAASSAWRGTRRRAPADFYQINAYIKAYYYGFPGMRTCARASAWASASPTRARFR